MRAKNKGIANTPRLAASLPFLVQHSYLPLTESETPMTGSTSTIERTLQQDGDDELQSGSPSPVATAKPAEVQMVVEEVAGTAVSESVDGGESGAEAEGGLHEEVSGDGAESTEEFAEASAEQLSEAVPAEESAFSDLRGIEGFEEYASQEAAESGATTGLLPEAGTALGGGEEFLPILGAIASTVLPTLVSKLGPAVARGVTRKLSGRARAALRLQRKGTGVISLIARLLETAEQQPLESGMETVDESLVEEITQQLEVIVGTDDRVRITSTTKVPWRRHCALRITMPSGAVYRGTGFLIGPRAVATAGHCVYLQKQGGWARRVEVIPGCNGTKRPFGQAVATSFRSVRGWVREAKPESDYGCIVLPPGAFAGRSLGSFGFGVFTATQLLAQPAVVAGYSGDKPFAELWGMARRIKTVTPKQLVYDIDTMGGNSGGPVYIKRNGKRYVVGIHNYGASSGNSATRVTAPVFQNLQRWSKVGAAAASRPKESVSATTDW